MPNHAFIYQNDAERYHRLISRQPDLLPVICEIADCADRDIVDLGAGTGRLTCALAPAARSIVALDGSAAMLRVTEERLRQAGLDNWSTRTADHRALPLAGESADVVVAGWTISYAVHAGIPAWRGNLAAIIGEIERILRKDGIIILFETMGTGTPEPTPPQELVPYYQALAEEYGFAHRVIRTDYLFADAKEAEELTRFFFGDQLADRAAAGGGRVCEYAGVWWRTGRGT